MKKQILLFLLMFMPLLANAVPLKINGIWYYLDAKNKNAAVTNDGDYGINDYEGDVVIPETVSYEGITYSVTSICDAFYGCSSLTTVTIPNGVTYIQENAFYGCTGLTTIDIPNSVTTIEWYAFSNCI